MVAVECYALTGMKFKLRNSCGLKREDNYSVVTLEVRGGWCCWRLLSSGIWCCVHWVSGSWCFKRIWWLHLQGQAVVKN